ncbi:MAG: Spy/CpxP family protein refolding chaperone [Pseudomonadota bacterium]|jgi:protein CpxP
MKTSILKKSLLVAVLALPLTALAQPGDGLCDGLHHHAPMHGKGHHDHGLRHVLHDLYLNDAQRDQIRRIMQDNRQKMRELAMNMRENRLAMRQLAAADNVDESRLQELMAQTAQTMGEMTAQRVHMQHAILAVLTPEQREAARAKMQEHGARPPHPGEDQAPTHGS